jgi:hypothetical protein
MAQRQRRVWWQFSASEARLHATLAALLMWSVAAVIAFAGSGYRSVFGPLKGSDFIQFYTLGHLDEQTAQTTLYDPDAFHRLQTQLVPESDTEHYLIVYPPHVAILFRPFAGMTYGSAALLWAAILAVLYGVCIWLAWRRFRFVLPNPQLLIAAAAAFPPFWYLVLHGQTTIVPLLAFCLGWLALEHRRPFWAGMALGLLLLKPHFALALAVLTVLCGEWKMMAGAAGSVILQVTATAALLGTSVLRNYAAVVASFPQLREALAPRPEQMHSISAITDRLAGEWGPIAWAVLSALVIFRTIQVWRSNAPVAVRMGVLVLASVLVNPHVYVYDAVVLAPALIWFAGSAREESRTTLSTRALFGPLVYALYLTLLFPTALALPIQASVIVLAGLFVVVSRDLFRSNKETVGDMIEAVDLPR